MKLNKFLVIIFLFICSLSFTNESNAQSGETFFDNGASGDTTETIDIPNGASMMYITVVDSAQTGTDTIMAFSKSGLAVAGYTAYSNVSVRDISSTALTTYIAIMVPGASTTKTYSIELKQIPPGEITLLRTNESTDDDYAPVTRIKYWFK